LSLEFCTDGASWEQLKQEEYIKTVLKSQGGKARKKGMTDAKMGEFWGLTARQVKDLRKKHGFAKYKGEGKEDQTDAD
jgi:hypothetical protein